MTTDTHWPRVNLIQIWSYKFIFLRLCLLYFFSLWDFQSLSVVAQTLSYFLEKLYWCFCTLVGWFWFSMLCFNIFGFYFLDKVLRLLVSCLVETKPVGNIRIMFLIVELGIDCSFFDCSLRHQQNSSLGKI